MSLVGYFDDTGTHKGSPVVGFAGLVGETTEWNELTAIWRAILAEYEVADFHASDCEDGRGSFQFPEVRRDALKRELARAIADRRLTPISTCVVTEGWDKIRLVRSTAAFFARFPTPFALCFDDCVQMAASWAEWTAKGSPIALLCNEQFEAKQTMETMFDAYKSDPRWNGQLSTLRFVRNAGCPSVQAAGLLANETFRYWIETENSPFSALRPVIDILWTGGDFSLKKAYDAKALVTAIRRFGFAQASARGG